MKVLAINGSPWTSGGNTALILHPFLEGMRTAGAEVELLYTKRLQINFCQGDYQCHAKEPGHCFQDDEMHLILPKLADADVWVLATPVYLDGMTAHLKNLLDRTLPLLAPSYELRHGRTRLALREGAKDGQLVLAATCGNWEIENFDPLVIHAKALARTLGRRYAGALLRPHASVIRPLLNSQAPIGDVFVAAREAGRQLVEEDSISPATLATISRELLSRDRFLENANRAVQEFLKASGGSWAAG